MVESPEFLACRCSYDQVHRSICMRCYETLLSNTRGGLHFAERGHVCNTQNMLVVSQFPPAHEAQPQDDGNR